MNLDELYDKIEELCDMGVHGRTPILAREPAEPGEVVDQVFTIEDVVVNNHGQVRLILQPSFDSEES